MRSGAGRVPSNVTNVNVTVNENNYGYANGAYYDVVPPEEEGGEPGLVLRRRWASVHLLEDSMERFVLRPFPTSKTWLNLQRSGHGVLHVTDDVELLARLEGIQAHGLRRPEKRRRILPERCRRVPDTAHVPPLNHGTRR